MKRGRGVLSILLVLSMLLSAMGVTALADEADQETVLELSGEEAPADVGLSPDQLCTFKGYVYEMLDGQKYPIGGVRITVTTPEPEKKLIEDVYADTETNGEWELELPKGEYRFIFKKSGYSFEIAEFKYDEKEAIDDEYECEDWFGTRKETETTEPTEGATGQPDATETVAPEQTDGLVIIPGTGLESASPDVGTEETGAPAGGEATTPVIILDNTTVPEITPEPTLEITAAPTQEPTAEPTPEPTVEITPEPTQEPTPEPTPEPTEEPVVETDKPVFASAQETTVVVAEEVDVSWSVVTNATAYVFTLMDMQNLEEVVEPTETAETTFALPTAEMVVDHSYMASVTAKITPEQGEAYDETTYWQFKYAETAEAAEGGEDGLALMNSITALGDMTLLAETDLAPATPTLHAPDVSTPPYVSLTWDDNGVTAPTLWRIYIFTNSTGTSVLDTVDVPGAVVAHAYAGGVVPGITYYVGVAGVSKDSSGNETVGSLSTIQSFVIPKAATGALEAPDFQTTVSMGYLVSGGSIKWDAVAGANAYNIQTAWTTDTGDSGGPQVRWSTTSITMADLMDATEMVVGRTYTVMVQAVNTADATKNSDWTVESFLYLSTAPTYVSTFTVSPTSPTVNQAATLTLTGDGIATGKTVRISVNGTTKDLTVTNNNQVTWTFTTASTHTVFFINAAVNDVDLPNSATVTVTAKKANTSITITPISVQKKSTAFAVTWTAISGATYQLTLVHMDGTSGRVYSNITTAGYTIPASDLDKIGPYYVQLTAVADGTIYTSDMTYFDVVDGAYTAWTGTVRKDLTVSFYTANTYHPAQTILNKDDKVQVIGELNDYYHVQLGTVGINAVRIFVATSGIKGKPASSGSGSSSGGSSSGGTSSGSGSSTATSSGGTISTTAYKEAFGTAATRKSSYEYIPKLYEPLMKAMEEGEVVPRTEADLLATSFAMLPDELNNAQYTEVRERAALNIVTAYMTYLMNDVATDSLLGQDDALKQLASTVSSKLTEATSQNKTMDESTQKLITEVQTSITALSQASGSGSLTGGKEKAVTDAIKKILEGKEVDEEIPKAILTGLSTSTQEEPVEVKLLRVLVALTDYEQTKLDTAITALGNSSAIADITKVQNAYLDYVFAVAKLHQLAYAFGGAPADTVVQNWGAEIARLIAVNKVYNTYAQ